MDPLFLKTKGSTTDKISAKGRYIGKRKIVTTVPKRLVTSNFLSLNSLDFKRLYRRLKGIPEALSRVCNHPNGLYSLLKRLILLISNP